MGEQVGRRDRADDEGSDEVAPHRVGLAGNGNIEHARAGGQAGFDFLWMHAKHRLCRPASLIAKDEADVEQITALAQERSYGGEQYELDLGKLATDAASRAVRKDYEERVSGPVDRAAQKIAKRAHSRRRAVSDASAISVTTTDATCASTIPLRKI